MEAKPLRILAVATYYRPYLSGLTVYLQRVAEHVAACGHQVVVLTSRFPQGLPEEEVHQGVRVVRVPFWLKVGKGVVMPGLYRRFWQEAKAADVVWLVLPQADAAPLAWLTKRAHKPLVVSYLCDVTLGKGWMNQAMEGLLALSHGRCLARADAVVALSEDYAASSLLLQQVRQRVTVIPPPVPSIAFSPDEVTALKKRWQLHSEAAVIGYVGRVSREKGLHILAQAMPEVWAAFPQARVICVGPGSEVPGEKNYRTAVQKLVRPFGKRWLFAGVLTEEELAAFYGLCTVLVLPSLNSTEAFGMVQVEAMSCGAPVVASDLPGVREPIAMTGMGLVVPPGDPPALAAALRQVLAGDVKVLPFQRATLSRFSPEVVTQDFLQIFTELSQRPLGMGGGRVVQ